MLRNTAAAVRNPLTEINKIYSQTLQTTQPNRPFSSISKLPDSTLVVDFILLPHQVAVFPLELLAKITWPSTPLLEDLDGEELRYFFYLIYIYIIPSLFLMSYRAMIEAPDLTITLSSNDKVKVKKIQKYMLPPKVPLPFFFSFFLFPIVSRF